MPISSMNKALRYQSNILGCILGAKKYYGFLLNFVDLVAIVVHQGST
jgi:hypothetical protein